MFFKLRFLLIIWILPLALSLSACASLFGTPNTPTPALPSPTLAPPTPTPPPSAAVVNGEYITLAEFQAELQRYKTAQQGLGKTVSDEDANKIVLEDLIAQVLLAQAANDAGFNLTEADLKSRIDILTAQVGGADALSKWKSEHSYDEASFRLALKRAAESAWMRDKIIADVSNTAEQVHVRQILTYNEQDALIALEQLDSGANFDELAMLFEQERGEPITRGELGWVPRGYLLDPKADEAVFALQAGAYTDVISTETGFHIFKAIEREPNHPLSPDALLLLQEQAIKKWMAQHREQSEIILAP
ncbi:MAG: SurA N-terminal domain-containing protein [Anaerolineales bacterium]|nr:SurA N-terminal domain-containing protein [Anaerolineales bacterium]